MNDKKQEQLQKVLQEHPELDEKLRTISADIQSEMQAKMIELLKEYGVELTAEDFKAPGGELSDDELDAVSGGGGCGCTGIGCGGGDYLKCKCFAYGAGQIKGTDDISEYGGCICAAAGAGATNWGDVKPHEVTDEEERERVTIKVF